MESRKEDTTLLSDRAGWMLDPAFLTDTAEKLTLPDLRLQNKDKTPCDMASDVKPYKAKLQQMKAQGLQHFLSVVKILKSSWHVDVGKYCDLLCKPGQEFKDRSDEFDRFEPCTAFTTNPLIKVDPRGTEEQMAELFSVVVNGGRH